MITSDPTDSDLHELPQTETSCVRLLFFASSVHSLFSPDDGGFKKDNMEGFMPWTISDQLLFKELSVWESVQFKNFV